MNSDAPDVIHGFKEYLDEYLEHITCHLGDLVDDILLDAKVLEALLANCANKEEGVKEEDVVKCFRDFQTEFPDKLSLARKAFLEKATNTRMRVNWVEWGKMEDLLEGIEAVRKFNLVDVNVDVDFAYVCLV